MSDVDTQPEQLAPHAYLGYALTSHFQPIVSVAYKRVFGAEALLRATDPDGHAVPPLDLFAKAAVRHESHDLDKLAKAMHLENFQPFSGDDRWLFLNCRPETLIMGPNDQSTLEEAVARHGYAPSQIVIELLEDASLSNEAVTCAIRALQSRGFRVAIDDFGTGASNFDRVWGVQPDFVKLDRSLVRRASLTRDDRRVAKMLVSMLHKMGALVVAEGVETTDEALSVMDADVDFVQGYGFGRPQTDLMEGIQTAEQSIITLWPKLSEMVSKVSAQEYAQIQIVRRMLQSAVKVFQASGSLEEAAARFFTMPETVSCFLIDASGVQLQPAIKKPSAIAAGRPCGPEVSPTGTNWSRRPYYKDAMRRPGYPSIYGPHSSIADGAFIYTIAVTIDSGSESRILCGNFHMSVTELDASI